MTGTLFIPPRFRPIDANGNPYPGCKLWTYQAQSTTLAATFTTSALTVPHANPVVADAGGEFQPVFLDPDAGHLYRFVLQSSDGQQVWDHDNIAAGGTGSGGGTTGPTGDPGLSVAELVIYQRATMAPATPSGGSFSFSTQTLTPPAGWSGVGSKDPPHASSWGCGGG